MVFACFVMVGGCSDEGAGSVGSTSQAAMASDQHCGSADPHDPAERTGSYFPFLHTKQDDGTFASQDCRGGGTVICCVTADGSRCVSDQSTCI
jgi:hypothetical protein